MKVLVTGGAGFVARHLRAELVSVGHDVVLTDIAGDGMIAADLVDASAMRQLVAAVRPDACVHLGAVSFVPDAARNQESNVFSGQFTVWIRLNHKHLIFSF